MRNILRIWLYRLLLWLRPKPDLSADNRYLRERLNDIAGRDSGPQWLAHMADEYWGRVGELTEALHMAGAGPWTIGPEAKKQTERVISDAAKSWGNLTQRLRESLPSAQGAFGDIELALQNVEWRREVQLSWLEFSRWGIQQIILISRLYYIKNPIIRRLIDVCAAYVFARGVEVSCSDETGNEVLKDFFDRNQKVIGHNALMDLERRKDYDGNIFFCLFPDATDSGLTNIRTIDATEINEIITDPNDADTAQFYKRVWTEKKTDLKTGVTTQGTVQAWYPDLSFKGEPPKTIGSFEVRPHRIYHRKAGAVSKWSFGCPRIYPALDWAKEARKYLEACASVAQSHAQFALVLTTKGGQQALEGAKQQMQTTVGPSANIWDTNPPAVRGATFASGPGTTMEAFKTQGSGLDPKNVSWYMRMTCMAPGVPPHFIGDVEDTNRATATSLDRPTETAFLERQESWREDLVTIATYVLSTSNRATNGKLRESLATRGHGDYRNVRIVEAPRKRLASGRWVYVADAAKPKRDDTLEVKCEFPAIREGDVPALIKATVEAMTLDNKAGQVIGIDEKEGVKLLYRFLDVDGGEEKAEEQYPSTAKGGKPAYNPNRMEVPLPAPLEKPHPQAGGKPQLAPDQVPDERGEVNPDAAAVEAALARLSRGLRAWEAAKKDARNGTGEHRELVRG